MIRLSIWIYIEYYHIYKFEIINTFDARHPLVVEGLPPNNWFCFILFFIYLGASIKSISTMRPKFDRTRYNWDRDLYRVSDIVQARGHISRPSK